MPGGVYKLSREAILAAELPITFTTRSNWRGSYPRDILCTFCRQHRLSIPEIIPLENSEVPGLHKKLKLTDSREQETNGGGPAGSVVGMRGTFKCEIKIFSRSQELVLWCTPKESFKKQSDAIQDAALKILTWLNNYFKNPKMSVENLTTSAYEIDIQFYPQCFFKEFELCQSVHNTSRLPNSDCLSKNIGLSKSTKFSVTDSDHLSGVSLSTGSLACISYNIYLLEGECTKELLESSEEFEFEIGVKAVSPHLEAVVTQMSVGQSIIYNEEVLAHELIMAAGTDSERILSLLNSGGCSLEYSITLLRVTEPLEERMERALFSPPLSKQRVEFGLQQIRESCAASLFYTTVHPLSGHFRAALLRKDHLYACVPVSVISVLDSRLINLCKCINPEVESNSWLAVPLILKAAARVPLMISENHLSMQRPSPYPPEVVKAIDNQPANMPESTCIKAVRVPCSIDKIVEPLLLNLSMNGYYLDVIAHQLGVTDACKVLISRRCWQSFIRLDYTSHHSKHFSSCIQ